MIKHVFKLFVVTSVQLLNSGIYVRNEGKKMLPMKIEAKVSYLGLFVISKSLTHEILT